MVNINTLKDFINNKVIINNEFLNDIHDKTELWNFSEKVEYCALFSDNAHALVVEFNKNGISIKKSFLFIDEELEVLENTKRFKEKDIEYEIIDKNKVLLKTRKELKEESFIENELVNIENDKLKYIYFECFGKHEKNKKIILSSIKKLSKGSKTYKKLYDILKLTSTTKTKML